MPPPTAASSGRRRDVHTGIVAGPISFELDGVQHVAVVAGRATGNYYAPDYSRLLVFRRGANAELPPAREFTPPPLNPPPSVASAEEIARGRELYDANCVLCHDDPGNAGGMFRRGLFPDLAYSPALPSRRSVRRDRARTARAPRTAWRLISGVLDADGAEAIRALPDRRSQRRRCRPAPRAERAAAAARAYRSRFSFGSTFARARMRAMDFFPARLRAPRENRVALALGGRDLARAACDSSRAARLAARRSPTAASTAQPGSLSCAQSRKRQRSANAATSAKLVSMPPASSSKTELAQPGRIDQHAAARQLDELPRRRRMPAALVVAQSADSLRFAAEQAIHQRRLADARRADEADRLAGADVGAQLVDAIAGRGARAHDRHADRGALDRLEQRRQIRLRVDLVQHDDGLGAAVPDGRDVALEPALVELAVHGRNDEEHVDVGGDDLRLGERTRRAPHQRRAPLEHVLNRRAILAVDDGDPIADDWPLDLRVRPQQLAAQVAERRAAAEQVKAALPFRDDSRRHPLRIAEPLEL